MALRELAELYGTRAQKTTVPGLPRPSSCTTLWENLLCGQEGREEPRKTWQPMLLNLTSQETKPWALGPDCVHVQPDGLRMSPLPLLLRAVMTVQL